MKSVLFRGSVLTQSGYGTHSRQIARYLLSKPNIDVHFSTLPWGSTPWLLDRNALDGFVGKVMDKSVKIDFKADVSLQLQLPNEWDPTLSPVAIGITAGVETDRCNSAWVTACNKMKRVIVPSQHTKSCLTNSGQVTVPLDIVPEAYSDACRSEVTAPVTDFATPFNFLVFAQITGQTPDTDRKNVFKTVKLLCEVFKDDPDVGIILKTNVGTNSLIDRNVTQNMLKQLLAEARKNSKSPKVYLVHGAMTDAEVVSLYRHPTVKALVTLTRGEGWGLPILEAAACGLPVIATNWSGHLDFLKHGKFVSILYQLQEVHRSKIDNNIFVQGARWAEFNADDAKKRVLKFRQSSTIPTQWAKELQPTILAKYSLDAVNAQYDALLGEYLT